ncbi:YcxB family protein [Blastopirellula marina]|uniref:YcxB-like C-terminal domain-containing protein n=1 Tax=Blastopirellula marina TaxID=124 RepID=A0A2S8GUJ3_9BACT|nr:YcxB family protein [Blastopirellula marina]PQO48089.1 hypothetical protein C5Y93_01515 [Blastopirellula marina]
MSIGAGDNPFQSPSAEQVLSAPAGKAILAEGTFTQRDLKATYRALVYGWRSILILCGVSLLVFSSLFGQLRGNYWIALAIIYPLFCLLPLAALFEGLFYLQTYWRTQNAELAKEPEQQRIAIREEGIDFVSKRLKAQLPWTRFARMQAKRRILVLILKPFGFISLPAHFFESRDAFLAARDLIAQRIGRAAEVASDAIDAEDYVEAEIPGAITAAGTLTKSEYYWTNWIMIRRGLLTTTVVGGGLLAFSIFLTFDLLASGQASRLPIIVMFVIAAFLFSLRWIRHFFNLRRTYRDVTSKARVRWTISADNLAATSETFTFNLQWDEVTRTIFRDDMLILVYQRTQAFALPRRYFASDDDWRQVNQWAGKS